MGFTSRPTTPTCLLRQREGTLQIKLAGHDDTFCVVRFRRWIFLPVTSCLFDVPRIGCLLLWPGTHNLPCVCWLWVKANEGRGHLRESAFQETCQDHTSDSSPTRSDSRHFSYFHITMFVAANLSAAVACYGKLLAILMFSTRHICLFPNERPLCLRCEMVLCLKITIFVTIR